MKLAKDILGYSILLIMLLGFTGCTAIQAPETPPLMIALNAAPETAYPLQVSDSSASFATSLLYDALVAIDANGNVFPALAESWTISPDGQEYMFTLRQGVNFHNGEPFLADSVVYSWQWGKEKALWPWQIASVEALDKYKLRVTTETPEALFLTQILPLWYILPPQYMRNVGAEEFNRSPIGTGPYQLAAPIAAGKLVLQANPNYWAEAIYPGLDQLHFQTLPDPTERLQALQAGAINLVFGLSAEEAQQIQGIERTSVITDVVHNVYSLGFADLYTQNSTSSAIIREQQYLFSLVDENALTAELEDTLSSSGGSDLSLNQPLMRSLNSSDSPILPPVPTLDQWRKDGLQFYCAPSDQSICTAAFETLRNQLENQEIPLEYQPLDVSEWQNQDRVNIVAYQWNYLDSPNFARVIPIVDPNVKTRKS